MVAAVLFLSLVVALIINMPVGIAIGASSLCAILADGRISERGTPEEILPKLIGQAAPVSACQKLQ